MGEVKRRKNEKLNFGVKVPFGYHADTDQLYLLHELVKVSFLQK